MKKVLAVILVIILCNIVYAGKGLDWHKNVNFGMHFDLHANMGDTELGAKITHDNLKASLELIKPDWIQCDCKGHPGVTSWSTEIGTKSPGIVNDALRIHADVCKELNIPLVMHYSGVWDEAAVKKHPQWEVVSASGKPYGGAMRSTCPLSGYLDELMIPQMLELIDKYDVDGFWVDGDCWAVQFCYCDRCKSEFKKRTNLDAPTDANDSNWNKWVDFQRTLFLERVAKYTKAVHDRKLSCLVTSNWLYTFGSPIEETVDTDYISGDLSSMYGLKSAMLEGHFLVNRNKEWDLMTWGFTNNNNDGSGYTAKTVNQLKQECAYITACGGASMIYDTPQRNGILTKWHCENYGEVSKFIKDREAARGFESVPQIAIIHSPQDFFYNAKYSIITLDSNNNVFKRTIGALESLLENHYHADVLMPSMIKNKYKNYKLIVINEQYYFDEAFVNNIKEYVKDGGKVLITGVYCPNTFSDLLGVTGKDVAYNDFFVEAGKEATSFKAPYRNIELTTAKTFRYTMYQQNIGENETNIPIITYNNYGNGVVCGVYFDIFTQYVNELYPRNRVLVKEIVDKLDCDFILKDVVAPSYVHFILRERDNKLIINLMNTGSISSGLERPIMIDNIPTVKEIKFKVKLDKRPSKVEYLPTKNNIKYVYKDGFLNVTINDFEILENLVIYE